MEESKDGKKHNYDKTINQNGLHWWGTRNEHCKASSEIDDHKCRIFSLSYSQEKIEEERQRVTGNRNIQAANDLTTSDGTSS
ncbi:hypothetical protein Tco_0505708 [Tanacetum coccineum]